MAIIRVYRYKVFNREHGAVVDTEFPVFATLEKISSLKAQQVLTAWLEIEESQLSSEGFYHP